MSGSPGLPLLLAEHRRPLPAELEASHYAPRLSALVGLLGGAFPLRISKTQALLDQQPVAYVDETGAPTGNAEDADFRVAVWATIPRGSVAGRGSWPPPSSWSGAALAGLW
jgi:hypothetical protein